MFTSENISISDQYVNITGSGVNTYGGNQTWFRDVDRVKNNTLYRGGCGLVASCDLLLYLTRRRDRDKDDPFHAARLRSMRTFMPENFLKATEKPIDRDEYLDYLRQTARFRYPVFPKVGSFWFEVLIFVNHMLKKLGHPYRIHYLFKNTKAERTRIIKDQLAKQNPVILVIGPHFFRFRCKKGVTFFRLEGDEMIPAQKNVFCHFVTITGLRFPKDIRKAMYLEISSWGKKYYVDYEELCDYISHYSFPWYTSIFYLKETDR